MVLLWIFWFHTPTINKCATTWTFCCIHGTSNLLTSMFGNVSIVPSEVSLVILYLFQDPLSLWRYYDKFLVYHHCHFSIHNCHILKSEYIQWIIFWNIQSFICNRIHLLDQIRFTNLLRVDIIFEAKITYKIQNWMFQIIKNVLTRST